jgi:N6-adenosine-specific RNA methylase IME4
MKTKEIIALAGMVKQLTAENAHCYLWTTNNHLKDGLEILEAWGFRYVTMITWLKDRQGLGQYYRGLTEHVLFGIKGMLPYKLLNGKRQQGLTGYFHKKGKHSEKPELFREVIEKVSYPPYIELFARKKTENWTAWGNEIPKEMQLKLK